MRKQSAESMQAMKEEAVKRAPKILEAMKKAERDLQTVSKQAALLEEKKRLGQGWDESDVKCFGDSLYLMIGCSKVFSHCANYLIKHPENAPKEIDDMYEKNVDLLGVTFLKIRALEAYYKKGVSEDTPLCAADFNPLGDLIAPSCTCKGEHTEGEQCACKGGHAGGTECSCGRELHKDEDKSNKHMQIPVDTEMRYRSARDAWFGTGRYR